MSDRFTLSDPGSLLHADNSLSATLPKLEAPWFASALKNAYADLTMIPYTSTPGTTGRTMQSLDLAPPTRVVYGFSGNAIPELYWAGARIGRRVPHDVLSLLARSGLHDEDETQEAAGLILANNARMVYASW